MAAASRPGDDRRTGSSGRFTTWIFGVVALVFALWLLWTWRFTMDDAFITLRYVRHVVEGLGPVWNPADRNAPVEGFTSYLHMWILAGCLALLEVDVVWLAKALGVVCSGALLGLLGVEVRRRRLGAAGAAIALSPFALPYVALHSVSGMETALFTLLASATALAAVAAAETGRRGPLGLFVGLGCLSTLTRPEFGLPFLALAGWLAWRRPDRRRELLVWLALLYVLPGLAVTLQRWQLYHDFVPNAFHVKQGGRPNRWGLIYVVRFLAVVALPYLIWMGARVRELWPRERDLVSVTAIWVGFTLAYFSTTVPMMGWWHRYLIPLLPLLALCTAVGLQAADGSRRTRLWVAAGLAALLLPTAAQVPLWMRWLDGHHQHERLYREVGRRLAHFDGRERWLAYRDVGALVYEAGWNVKDVVGLNTRRADLGSPCQMRTDLVLRMVAAGTTPAPCPELYAPVARLPFLRQPAGLGQTDLVVLARVDLPDREVLGRHLEKDWPGPYVRSDERLARYWTRLVRIFFQS